MLNGTPMSQLPKAFWSIPSVDLLKQLRTAEDGLSSEEAGKRLAEVGPNLLKSQRRTDAFILFIGQFKSPIILILILAAILSFFLRDIINASIILSIVVISGVLGFWQERGAVRGIEKLVSIVQIKASVIRDSSSKEIPVEMVVPGDIVTLSAGDSAPADSLILESKDLYLDEAFLTGETYPIEKTSGVLPVDTPLNKRINSVFMGTHVVSGSARVVAVHTGKRTQFGKISEHLKFRPPETEFEHGVRRFGYFLMEITLILVITIFAINVFRARPILESILFSVALAVGLTPQLLPAIISINLAHGASRMAVKKVVVKRLASIENFGSMNILCSDKTGTLTEGLARLHSTLDIDGNNSEKVLLYAYLNAFFESGFVNPIDMAIRNYSKVNVSAYRKLDEVPYDFNRKRLSILVEKENSQLMVTKGTLPALFDICSLAETGDGQIVSIDSVKEKIKERFNALSNEGFRVIGIAYREMGAENTITKKEEKGLVFLGLVAFFDPPRAGISETIKNLKDLGINLKVITGDNHIVAAHLGQQIGLVNARIITGADLNHVADNALLQLVNNIDIFAEVEPNQKERIILALRKSGNVVGYMGDGINDALALHAADVGISVDSAVDVAKEAADIILLDKDLSVLQQGVKEGRVTFANTLKYVFMATSANFGNMFSMAGSSLFLSFLPLLPKQILLTNLMTDFPEINIATDNVDSELVEKPRRWNIKFIRNFMLTFGILSSVFDYLTFGILLVLLHATITQFRTGWFIESVVSASVVVLVVRSRRAFYRSRPGKPLLIATLIIISATFILPYTPLAGVFGFVPLPPSFLFVVAATLVLYMISAELAKKIFYRRATLEWHPPEKFQ
jgi:P-type Mg2+ transporter